MKFVKATMLSQKSLRLLLIASTALISIYFWVGAARGLWVNHSLKKQIAARVIQWEVEESGSDRYAIKARYSFEQGGQIYHGATRFEKPTYLNQATAVAALREMATRPDGWMAWFDDANPSRSSLEKIFPRGFLLRAIISSMVLVYFVLFSKKFFEPN
jgi:hypothetical protein